MLERSLRAPRQRTVAVPDSPATQVFAWPRPVARAALLMPLAALGLCVLGVYSLAAGMEHGRFEAVAGGLIELTLGFAVVFGILMLHVQAAREVRFMRDSLIVRQTWRRDLVLPYCRYREEWLADLSNPRVVRIVVFGRNRGCLLLIPPPWVLGALDEIRRIQEAEGWYEPEGREEG